MNKFSTGLIVGSMIGAAGLVAILSDKKSRHKLENSGSKLLNKTTDMINDVTNSI
jgi:hypothetical protein